LEQDNGLGLPCLHSFSCIVHQGLRWSGSWGWGWKNSSWLRLAQEWKRQQNAASTRQSLSPALPKLCNPGGSNSQSHSNVS
jgi:hypothetical protein